MRTYECTTQEQLDKAIAEAKPTHDLIVLMGSGTFQFRGSSSPTVVARGSSSPRVVAWGSSSPRVVAWGSSSPTVVARESSSPRVVAWESSSPRVVAWGSSSPRVEARESSSPRVVAWESSSPRVVAWGSSSPTVVARESSSPRVVAWGSSSPTVVARESSSPTVVARESSSPRGSATKYAPVTVHRYDWAKVDIKGAVVIEPPDITTADAWCEFFGIATKRGKVVLYKAVSDTYESGRGFAYPIGETVEAPDWNDRAVCGGGLHLGPHPRMTRDYFPEATRFLACEVKLTDLVPIVDGGTAKVKARKVKVLHEVDEWTAEPVVAVAE